MWDLPVLFGVKQYSLDMYLEYVSQLVTHSLLPALPTKSKMEATSVRSNKSTLKPAPLDPILMRRSKMIQRFHLSVFRRDKLR